MPFGERLVGKLSKEGATLTHWGVHYLRVTSRLLVHHDSLTSLIFAEEKRVRIFQGV